MRRYRTIPRVCRQCGCDFMAFAYHVRKGGAIYCGNSCQNESRRHPSTVNILDDGTAQIPLHKQDGSIRAYAIIDAADANWAAQFRWYLGAGGYAHRTIKDKRKSTAVRLHRELLGIIDDPTVEGDHINRNRLDNRRSNLRIVSRQEQAQNVSGVPHTSAYRGVHWDKSSQKWAAQVGTNGKTHYLGRFTSEEEAAEAARVARHRLLPFAVD